MYLPSSGSSIGNHMTRRSTRRGQLELQHGQLLLVLPQLLVQLATTLIHGGVQRRVGQDFGGGGSCHWVGVDHGFQQVVEFT